MGIPRLCWSWSQLRLLATGCRRAANSDASGTQTDHSREEGKESSKRRREGSRVRHVLPLVLGSLYIYQEDYGIKGLQLGGAVPCHIHRLSHYTAHRI